MASKNIVIAPCGNKAFLFRDAWLKFPDEKDFDLCLLFYHEEIAHPGLYSQADHFYHLKNFKYTMIHELLTQINPGWLDQYDHFYFPDDDIEIDTRQINALFAFSKAFHSSISCASLTPDSFCSWPMFKHKPHHFCRYVGQIEVMAPLFDAASLKRCLPSFNANRSSWGMDSVWAKLLGYPEDKFIVFDAITMRHIHPVGKGELYSKLGSDPTDEWAAIIEKYEARRHNLQVFSCLYVLDNKNKTMVHGWYRYREYLGRRRRYLRRRLSPLATFVKKIFRAGTKP